MGFFDDVQKKLARHSLFFGAATEFRTVDDLLPGERKLIADACDLRQREFATGRWCVRRLLTDMGVACGEIGRGMSSEAAWPEGTCGSIAHTRGACCAVASFRRLYQSVGLDIERVSRRISPPACRLFLNKDETNWINRQVAVCENVCLTIFSIKECIYKMLYPLVKKPFPFSAISVRPWNDDGGFACHVNVDLNKTVSRGSVLHGWKFSNQTWLLTVAAFEETNDMIS